jgi:4-hydroxybenzoate polyprenyltransferase
MFQPLVERLKIREGGLIFFNITLSIFFYKNGYMVLMQSALAVLCMSALYGFNDYVDRAADLINPKKNKQLSLTITQHPVFFLIVNITLSITCVILATILVDYYKGLLVILLVAINMLYSLYFKSKPIADLVIVGIWGGLFVSISANAHHNLLYIAGLMTTMAHLFQTLTDKEVDIINKVYTTAAKFKKPSLILLICCVLLSCFMYLQKEMLLAATAIIPFLSFISMKNVSLTWNISRTYFGVSWLILIYNAYGGF